MDSAAYVFPAVRGTQAQREYYISMVPLDVMSKIFQFADEDLPPEIRAQRILNKSRIPEIRDYILSNPDSYVFSALTVSVDGNMEFMPADKTTFHDSILIALYGKQALKYIQEKARSYDKLLLDHINKHATDEETYVAVSLCLDDGTVLRIKRSWTAKGKKVEQQIIVEKDGVVDKYLGESWSYYIEEILPFGIARFFFFNNEKITQLADDTSFEQIKSSIKSAIGVSTIEKAIEHTDEVIRRKKNALAAFEHSEENVGYQEIEKQIVDIDIRLADATKQANELERKRETLSAKLEAKEKEFWSSGGDLSRNRDAIKLEMQKISSEVERVNEEILQMAVDASTPLFMCRNLVTQSYDNELSSQQSEAKLYSDKIEYA